MAKLDTFWGVENEKKFILGLGTWRNPNPELVELDPGTKRLWFEKYIDSHRHSSIDYHIDGVLFAKRLIKKLDRERFKHAKQAR